MEEYETRSAASILASVKEQEARFEQLTRALEEERRHVSLQLERANMPHTDHLPWQQVVIQVMWFILERSASPAHTVMSSLMISFHLVKMGSLVQPQLFLYICTCIWFL